MSKLLTPLLFAAAIALSGMGSAAECVPSTTEPEITIDPYYIDNDVCQFECVFSIWWYEESNGIAGLQRGDEVVDDTCGGAIESDTIVGY